MLNNVFQPLRNELRLIESKIDEMSKIKSGSINDLTNISFDYFDINLRPALTLIAAQTQKKINSNTISFAILIQLIYLSSLYHHKVPNENSEFNKKQFEKNVQFPVLVGDYLYSNFYNYLCNKNLFLYIPYFSQLILDLNNNIANRIEYQKLNNIVDFNILSSEREILFESCCYLGAQSVGSSSYLIGIWKKIGRKLGRIEASNFWKVLPQDVMKEWEEFEQIVDLIPSGFNAKQIVQYAESLANSAGWNIDFNEEANKISV